MKRVVIGLSGGVDSSVAAYLLKQQGYEVIGLFMVNWHDTTGTLEGDCPWHDDRVFAELVARKLDIALHIVDLSEQYRHRVVDYMFGEYEKGRTPNPDVLCNREIKFDVFLKEALKLGADYVATGHYCRKAEEILPDGTTIHKLLAGADLNKDQSYFLCQLSQEQLQYAMFPVGGLQKPEVRRIAEEQGLATAKRKDSQGICFVGKVDLPVFLQQKLASKHGNVHEILPAWPKYGRVIPGGSAGCVDAGHATDKADGESADERHETSFDYGFAGKQPKVSAASDQTNQSRETFAGKQPGTLTVKESANEQPGVSAASDQTNQSRETFAGKQPGTLTVKESADKQPEVSAASDQTNQSRETFAGGEPSTEQLTALAAPWRYTVRDGKKVGEHNGAHFYTVGQRKGLGIGGRKESLFILGTDVAENVIYVGEGDAHPGLWRPALHIQPEEMHWVNPARALSTGQSGRFSVRIRYRQPLQGAVLYVREEGVFLLFDTPQRGITPGQFAAWYDGDELVGSGVISE